jgi:PPE-repeat protein
MFKAILLATTVLVATPAFAQNKPMTATPPAQEQTVTPDQTAPAPADTTTATPADAATTAQATPAPQTETAQPTPAQPAATASAEPAAQPAATQDQVAQAVSRDFGTYDKDANGTLSQAEFGSWISTLRKASEPTFKPGSPEAETYVGQAFAATDLDKNKSIDKTELTTFLTPKAS